MAKGSLQTVGDLTLLWWPANEGYPEFYDVNSAQGNELVDCLGGGRYTCTCFTFEMKQECEHIKAVISLESEGL